MLKKILAAALLLAAVLTGGTGCMKVTPFAISSAATVDDLALDHMREKYGEEFTYSSAYGNSFSTTRKIFVTCPALPGEEILVEIENYTSDTPIYRDNYLAVKYRQEVIDLLKTHFAAFGSDIHVFHTAAFGGQSADLPADADFRTFLQDTETEMTAMIELRASRFTSREALEAAAEQIASDFSRIVVTVIVVEDEVFGTLDRSGLNELIRTKSFVAKAAIYVRNGELRVTWTGEEGANG